MIRYAHADRTAALVLQTPRGLARRVKNECVGTWNTAFQQPELPGVESRITPDLIQVGAYEREVMVSVGASNPAHALEGVLVIYVTSERITGVGRIGNHPAGAHDLGGTPDGPALGVDRMERKVLG